MTELIIVKWGSHYATEKYGIVTRSYCTLCGKTLSYLEFDYTNCDKKPVKERNETISKT